MQLNRCAIPGKEKSITSGGKNVYIYDWW